MLEDDLLIAGPEDRVPHRHVRRSRLGAVSEAVDASDVRQPARTTLRLTAEGHADLAAPGGINDQIARDASPIHLNPGHPWAIDQHPVGMPGDRGDAGLGLDVSREHRVEGLPRAEQANDPIGTGRPDDRHSTGPEQCPPDVGELALQVSDRRGSVRVRQRGLEDPRRCQFPSEGPGSRSTTVT